MEKLKALIGVFVLFAGIYYAWNMIPPRFHNSQFQDDLDDIARRTTYTTITDDDIKKIVISKALADGITLSENQILVERTGQSVAISVHYSVHVDLTVYQTDLDFVTASHNKMIGT